MHTFGEPSSINGGDRKIFGKYHHSEKRHKDYQCNKQRNRGGKARGIAKFGGKIPANLKLPLRDGDTDREDDENYANSYFVNANCKTAPGIVDKSRQPIIDKTEFYSGCYGHASISFYAFNSNGNKGIACGLNNLMKTRDGEPLGGRNTAEVDFAGMYDDDDDFLN